MLEIRFNARWVIPLFLASLVLPLAPVHATTDTGQITVTGSVAPSPISISTSLSQDVANINQDEVVTYTLAYTSSNVTAVPVTLQVSWPLGLIDGATTPSVAGLDYVVGSATTAVDSTVPVVDTLNRTITWNIANVPGSSTNSVTFQLQANDVYSGSLEVTYDVLAAVLSPSGVSDATVTTTYSYLTPPPTPTPSPAASSSPSASSSPASPSPSPTATVTVSPSPSALPRPVISSVEINSIGKRSTSITITTSRATAMTLRFGTELNELTEVIASSYPQTTHTFVLTNLNPETKYFFSLQPGTQTPLSELFTFQTADAAGPEMTETAPTTLIISNRQQVLYVGPTTPAPSASQNVIKVIKQSVIDLQVTLPNSQELKSIEVFLRRPGVLGSSTAELPIDELQSSRTQLLEISPGVFVGKLRTAPEPGLYDMISRVEDIYGNITETKLQQLRIIKPLTVIDARTQLPVSESRILFSVYDPSTKLYQPLSNITTAIPNPSFTSEAGTLNVNFFPGKYEATVWSSGYTSQKIYFEFRSDDESDLPTISLEPLPFGIISQITTINDGLSYIWQRQYELFKELAGSRRVGYATLAVLLLCNLGMILTYLILKWHEKSDLPTTEKAPLTPRQRAWAWLRYWVLLLLHVVGEFAIIFWLIIGSIAAFDLGKVQGYAILILSLMLVIASIHRRLREHRLLRSQ